jgi:hypothetical protein
MIGFLFVKVKWNNVYVNIIQEDSLVENSQFVAYLGSSMLAIYAGLGCLKKSHLLNGFILLILAFLLMFVSLEEISWGQRLFLISTPEWFQQNNTQKEINVHNLKPVQHVLHLLYVLVGALFTFGWIPAKYISSSRRMRLDVKAILLLFSPRWYLMLFFVPTTVINMYFLLTTNPGQRMLHWLGYKAVQIGNFVIWRDQEPAELLLALGCLLFVTAIMMRLRYISNDGGSRTLRATGCAEKPRACELDC